MVAAPGMLHIAGKNFIWLLTAVFEFFSGLVASPDSPGSITSKSGFPFYVVFPVFFPPFLFPLFLFFIFISLCSLCILIYSFIHLSSLNTYSCFFSSFVFISLCQFLFSFYIYFIHLSFPSSSSHFSYFFLSLFSLLICIVSCYYYYLYRKRLILHKITLDLEKS